MQSQREKKKCLELLEQFLQTRLFARGEGDVEAADLQEHLHSSGFEFPLKQVHKLLGDLVEAGTAGRVPCSKLGEELHWNDAGKVVDAEGREQKSFKFVYFAKSASPRGVQGSQALEKMGVWITATENVRDSLVADFLSAEALSEKRAHPEIVFRVGDAYVRLSIPAQELPLSVQVGRRSGAEENETATAAERSCTVAMKSAVLSRFKGGAGGQYRIKLERDGREAFLNAFGSQNSTCAKTLSGQETEIFFRDLIEEDRTRPVQGGDWVASKLKEGLLKVGHESGLRLKLPLYVVVKGFQVLVLPGSQ
jgi:hypothetical protein